MDKAAANRHIDQLIALCLRTKHSLHLERLEGALSMACTLELIMYSDWLYAMEQARGEVPFQQGKTEWAK